MANGISNTGQRIKRMTAQLVEADESGFYDGVRVIPVAEYDFDTGEPVSAGEGDANGFTTDGRRIQAVELTEGDGRYVQKYDWASGELADPPTEVPANTAVPTITGIETVGETLTTTNGTWTGAPFTATARKWQSADDGSGTNAADIASETSATYVVAVAAGKYVRSGVLRSNVIGDAADYAYSAWEGPIAAVLAISGTPDASVAQGAAYSFTPTVDGGHTPYSFSFSAAAPTGWTFDTDTGEVASAAAPLTGLTDLVITVTDADGLTDALAAFDVEVVADETPNAFSFTDVTDATLSTVYVSNQITVAGLGAGVSVAVSVTGGEYRKNGGSWTSAAGTAENGDGFEVRQTSSSSNATATNTVLTIGGVSDTYTVTTVADAGVMDPSDLVNGTGWLDPSTLPNGNVTSADNLLSASDFAAADNFPYMTDGVMDFSTNPGARLSAAGVNSTVPFYLAAVVNYANGRGLLAAYGVGEIELRGASSTRLELLRSGVTSVGFTSTLSTGVCVIELRIKSNGDWAIWQNGSVVGSGTGGPTDYSGSVTFSDAPLHQLVLASEVTDTERQELYDNFLSTFL